MNILLLVNIWITIRRVFKHHTSDTTDWTVLPITTHPKSANIELRYPRKEINYAQGQLHWQIKQSSHEVLADIKATGQNSHGTNLRSKIAGSCVCMVRKAGRRPHLHLHHTDTQSHGTTLLGQHVWYSWYRIYMYVYLVSEIITF